jgi:hypothetical protein
MRLIDQILEYSSRTLPPNAVRRPAARTVVRAEQGPIFGAVAMTNDQSSSDDQ